MDPQLQKFLTKGNLEHAVKGFLDGGVTTVGQLTQLTMQDYQSVGIFSMTDRRNLFELIQLIRRDQTSGNAPAGPSDISDYTSARSTTGNRLSGRSSARPEALSGRPAHASSVPMRVSTPLRSNNTTTTGGSALRRDPELAKSTSALRRDPRDDSFRSSKLSVSGGSARGSTGMPANPLSSRPPSVVGGRPGSVVSSRPASRNGATPLRRQSSEAGGRAGGGPARRRANRITVVVRKRPLSHNEGADGLYDILETEGDQHLTLLEPKQKVDLTRYIEKHRFVYDLVLDEHKSNRYVYEKCCRPLIDTVFEGGFATCFAYGQTGSGKTFTMLGREAQEGIYLMAAKDLYARLEHGMNIKVSFFEIYGSQLYDLLNERQKLACREDSRGVINICGLTEHRVDDTAHLMQVIAYGNTIRAAGSTSMNADSSRSHAILHLTVVDGRECFFGRFTFIDLAGSERGADTNTCDRTTRYEGSQINKSLLALKECIRALDQNHPHIPFRGSKLTAVLRDCFTGNSRTVMIGNVSPASGSCEHTLNTLRYADRVKELKKDRSSKTADEIMMGQMPTEEVEVVGISNSFADRRAQERRAQSNTNRMNDSRSSSMSFSGTPLKKAQGSGAPTRQNDDTSSNFGEPMTSQSSFRMPSSSSQQRATPKPVHPGQANSSRHPTPLRGEDTTKSSRATGSTPSVPNTNSLSTEEEILILSHGRHIDTMMDLFRREMVEAKAAENPDADMVRYCKIVDHILSNEAKGIEGFRKQIASYLKLAENARRT